MRRQSFGTFTLLTFVAAASATMSAGPSSQNQQSKHVGDRVATERSRGNGNGSPFVTMKPCSVSNSRLQFVSGRNPFIGGGAGAYGDIFFAGGGNSSKHAESTSAPAASPAAESPAVVSAPAPTPAPTQPPRMGTGTPTVSPVVTPTTTAPAMTTTAPVIATDNPPLPQPGGASTVSDPTPVPKAVPLPVPIASPTPQATNPEPASLLLIGLGLSGVAIIRRRSGQRRS